MVERQIVRCGVRDERVLEAVRSVPREAFLPEDMREFAYEDSPARDPGRRDPNTQRLRGGAVFRLFGRVAIGQRVEC